MITETPDPAAAGSFSFQTLLNFQSCIVYPMCRCQRAHCAAPGAAQISGAPANWSPAAWRKVNRVRGSDCRSLVGLIGLEPMTPRLSSVCSNQLSYRPWESRQPGGKGTRTPDIQLAKLALYQLSYTPGWSVPIRQSLAQKLNCALPFHGLEALGRFRLRGLAACPAVAGFSRRPGLTGGSDEASLRAASP